MIHDYSMFFRLDTPREVIDRAIDDARSIAVIGEPHFEKRRTTVRGLGNLVLFVASFEVTADEETMETLGDKLWDDHPDVVSTILIPHPSTEPAPVEPKTPPENQFTKEALLERFGKLTTPKRSYTVPR